MAAARAQLSTLRYFPAASVDGNFFFSRTAPWRVRLKRVLDLGQCAFARGATGQRAGHTWMQATVSGQRPAYLIEQR